MNKRLLCSLLLGVTLPLNAQTEKLPAFPGAEGFGRYTTGGRGGAVYHVTSLADDGSEGTLRWALNKSGRRTIVFDISGTIHLTSALAVKNSHCTIAGQTAPGDGICIADYPFTITTNDVIVRYVRTRLGNKYVAYHEGDGFGSMDQNDIIIDHCSISWSIDECCSVYGGKNLTVQWSIISQSLVNAGHSKGAHGYGGNWGGSGCTYHHNLVAHHTSRVPRLGPRQTTQTDERLDLRNNVFYNWAGLGCYGGEGMNVNIVNNYYKPGPGTDTRGEGIRYRIAAPGIRTTSYCQNSDGSWNGWYPMWHVWGKYYVNGNVNPDYADVTADNWTKGVLQQIDASGNDGTFTSTTADTIKLESPIEFYHVTTHTADKAYEKVLAYAGASLSRDAIDAVMVSDTRNRTATYTGSIVGTPGMIDSQDDLKPSGADDSWSAWPTLSSSAAPTDTDGDGMSDTWEDANGLDKNNASDGALTASNGYTNLENYLNSIVADITNGELSDGEELGIKEYESSDPVSTANAEISSSTKSADDGAAWTFESEGKEFVITNTAGKGYGSSGTGVKFSAIQYTMTIPEDMYLTKVRFTGHDNYDTGDSYIKELNGQTFGSTDYVFPSTKEDKTYEVSLTSPAKDKTTFTISGKQAVLALTLTLSSDDPTAIRRYTMSSDELTNVYSASGRTLKSGVIKSSATDGLTRGLYVIDGHKVMVK